jgi:DNA/RNA endonuclease G (NUC1)
MHPPASGPKYAPVRFRLVALLLVCSLLALAIPTRFIRIIPSAEAASTTVVISEFRVRGPNGAADEFVELYNLTNSPIDISGWKINASNNAGTTSTRLTVNAGTTIPAHGHFLAYDSSASGGPYSGTVAGNQPFTTGITDDGGIALLNGSNVIIDQVGMSTGSAYKEGTVLASLGSTNANKCYERKPGDGSGSTQDTDNNSTDFQVLSPCDPQNLASAPTPAVTTNSGALQFSAATYNIAENGGSVTINVTRTGGSDGAVSVNYATSNGTATAGADYTATSGTLNFANGDAVSKTFTVPVLDDAIYEGNETVTLTLSSPAGGATLGSPTTSTLTIVENDPQPNQPIATNCPNPPSTVQGTATSVGVSATDPDGRVTSASITSGGAPGITLDNFVPAAASGGTATATLNVSNTTAAGTYNVAIQYSNNDSPTPQTATCTVTVNVQSPPTAAGAVVISQVYGGGGNAGAFYRYDFIELFNRSSQPVNLNGWSVQYASAGGGATAAWNRRTPLTGVINPGQYFLVREASGANTGAADLPPADVIGSIAMGGTDGKVALVSNNVDLPAGCPVGSTNVIDFVGYGIADCYEGTTAAPQMSNTTADSRTHNGCKDTDLNNLNFTEGPPAPRNSGSTLNVCPAGDLAPDVFSTDPANGGTNTPLASNVTVNFDAAVNVADGGFTISCSLSGPHTLTVTGGPTTFTLNPDTDFVSGEQCTATVLASHVTAQNAAATPMAADYTWTFGTLIARDPNEHLVMGNPSGAVTDEGTPLNYLLMKPQYATSYNNDKGTPNWTSWHLDSSWTTGVSDRQNDFRADDTLPASFKHVQSGYNFATYGFDRGHMTPSADRTSSVADNSATFLMTNMVPQASGNNQGPWASMENDLRSLLNGSANELYIISGGQGTGGNSTTGHWDTIQDTGGNTVNVPAFTWKVVMVMSRQDGDDVARVNNATRTFAVIMPNNDNIRPDDWRKYLATVDQVEALTGYNFFSNVPESIQNVIEARLDDTLDTTPVANNQSVSTAEDTQKSITLTASDFNVNNVFTYTVGAPSHGVLSGTAPNLTYTPEADYNGPDSFTFKVNDGDRDSNTATVTITVTPVNDAPVAVDDSANTDEDTPVTVSVLANDTDVEGDTLSVASVGTAAHGSATIVGSDVKYTPAADYNGADSFTYTVSDGHGGTATGTVNVNVAGVNDGPVANNDTATTDEDTAVNVNVVGNDSDLDGDALSVTAVTQPAHGSAAFSGGSVTYTPAADYNGGDSFTYTVSDGHGGSATATVSVTVNAVNDNPTAANDSATVAEDSGANTVNVLTNDADVDGDTLSVSAITQGAHGSVVNNGGSVSYTPNPNYNGSDSFGYTVSDGHGGTATATVTVNVTAVNDNPTATADSATTDEDTPVSVDVVFNDNDIDGDTLSLESVDGATHGSVVIDNGKAVFTPAANYNGPASFTYVVSDGNGGTANGSVSVTVNPVNDNPVAGADAAATDEDSAVTVNVLANDSDVDGDTLNVQSAGGASKGSVAVTADNKVVYTPNSNANGADSFTYTVSDGHGGTASATVGVTINAVNDAPSISNVPGSATIAELAAYAFTASATDVDGDGLTFSLVGAPAGAAINPSTGEFSWTPTEAQGGTGVPFNFTVRVSDGTSSADSPVSITVTEVNQAPTLAPVGNRSVLVGGTLTFTASGADADLPAQTLTYSLTGAFPAGATINPATGVFNWTPTAAQAGQSYTFNVRVTDNGAGPLFAEQSVTVSAGYTWSGFLQPINQNGNSVFNLGRTIPVKFQLTGASAGITNAVARLYVAKITDNVVGTEEGADSTSNATEGNLFRYADGQYIFNLSTKGLTVGTYQLRVDTGDGVLRVVNISLR